MADMSAAILDEFPSSAHVSRADRDYAASVSIHAMRRIVARRYDPRRRCQTPFHLAMSF